MNELQDIQDFLASCAPFDVLPDSELESLCRTIEISYEPGNTVVMPISAENTELHLIRRGAVALLDSDSQLISKRGEREVYGYPSMLTGKPTRLLGRTVEDSLIYHIPEENFHQLRRNFPAFDRYFSSALSQRVSDASQPEGAGQGLMASRVDRLMNSPAVTVHCDLSVQDTAVVMAEKGVSSVMVIGASLAELKGIFTDRDMRRRVVAARQELSQPVSQFMTPEPVTVDADDPALEALLTMNDSGIHHLPVLRDGELAGVITLTDLYCALNNHPIYLSASIRRQPDAASVAEVSQRRFDLLGQLISMGMSARAIGNMMTSVTDAATQRLVTLAEAELGPSPMPYAWVCFGSQARREQTGRTDQDNGIIMEREPNEEESAYFRELSERVCNHLNDCGFVYCPGEIMASNPKWRMSLKGWQQQFAQWIDAPEPKPLMYASIFFDQRAVCGETALVDRLSEFTFQRTGGNSIFLRFMAENALAQRPPLGFFRRFVLEQDGEHGETGLNLKQRGVVPIISLARMRALELGIAAPETWERLREIDQQPSQSAASLRDAMDVIGQARLRHQLSQWETGEAVSNWVNPDELSPLARRNLKAAFTIVADAQGAMARRYRLE